jgi:hypothetical protein
MVELLTVVGIIAMLVALLVPSLRMVRRIAKETKQKAQFATIDMAITAFKGDWGDYPPSSDRDFRMNVGCGALSLAEALLGQDLLGFHRDSGFCFDGFNSGGIDLYPDLSSLPPPVRNANLAQRIGPYLEVATANAFMFNDLFGGNTGLLSPNCLNLFFLCDVFGVKKIVDFASGEVFMAGTPILYYKANTTSKSFVADGQPQDEIYNIYHNQGLIDIGVLPELNPSKQHQLHVNPDYFYSANYKIKNPKVSLPWPYRPDSYILISAGADGLYGTSDDICNF